jgi:hypothetical protein
MENVVKPMTKEYLKNYPKNKELYRVVSLITNGVMNKVNGRLYPASDFCLETAFKYSTPFEEEWVYSTLRNFIYQSQVQLSTLEYQNLQIKLTNDANERTKIREQFIQDLSKELKVVFPDSKISWIEKSHYPHGYNYHEVKKMFIEIDWTPSPS